MKIIDKNVFDINTKKLEIINKNYNHKTRKKITNKKIRRINKKYIKEELINLDLPVK